jgi:OPT oligopeptide transporter protein
MYVSFLYMHSYLLILHKFSMWSHDVVVRSVSLAADLKVGQYLKIPPRVMFLTQVWGALLGMSILWMRSTSDHNKTPICRRYCQLW